MKGLSAECGAQIKINALARMTGDAAPEGLFASVGQYRGFSALIGLHRKVHLSTLKSQFLQSVPLILGCRIAREQLIPEPLVFAEPVQAVLCDRGGDSKGR